MYMQQEPRRRSWNADIVNVRRSHAPSPKKSENIKVNAQNKKPVSVLGKIVINATQKQHINKTSIKQRLEMDVDESTLEDVSKKMYKPSHYKHSHKLPMMDHVGELRRRALWCMISLLIGGVIGYRYQEQIIAILVKPLGQKLFYTSPTGGFDFLIKICLFFGFILAVPVIIYNLFKFISPAIPAHVTYSFSKIIVVSILLALAGVSFAYFVSLPAALHFLNNFSNEQVSSLISAQEYFNFVMIYMAGFALLFQMPLVFSFINKVKPLKPARLLKQQKVVILISFIVAAILTPTPDPINQALMAAPIIALYQTSIGVVWRDNKKGYSKNHRNSQLEYA